MISLKRPNWIANSVDCDQTAPGWVCACFFSGKSENLGYIVMIWYEYVPDFLVHTNMILMFWFIQICSLCFGAYKYVPYVLVHTDMFLMFWCIQICSLCFGSYKYVPYVLVHTNMFLMFWFIQMSQHMTKPTKWRVHSAKTQISLGIHLVWSVFAVHSVGS